MKNFVILLSVLFSFLLGYGQNEYSLSDTKTKNEFSFIPKFTLGTGSLVYFGDLYRYKDSNPFFGNLGMHLGLGTQITSYLDAQFYFGAGRLSYQENTVERNANFKTSLITTGLQFSYNFDNFFTNKPVVHPLFTLGLENVEFNSKTDLNGDLNFETDIRKLNLDGQGQYALNALSLPIGIGAEIDLVQGFSVRFTTTMHFTFTDYIDGISSAGEGARKGNSANDRFVYTGVTIVYTLDKRSKSDDPYVEALFGDTDDEDADLVYDINDHCPHTPEGVVVDEKGCPLDGDKDHVPDYKDLEMETLPGSIVNLDGVAYTDDDFFDMFMAYLDSAGYYGKTVKTVYSSNETGRKIVHTPRPTQTIYSVQVAASTDELSTEQFGKILSIPNVKILNEGDSTFYLVGSYNKMGQAIEQKVLLGEEGIDGQVIAVEKGKRIRLNDRANAIEENILSGETQITETVSISDEIIYRVQIGAFSYPLDQNIFDDVDDLIYLKGQDGLVRYMTGSYSTIEQAAERKIDVLLRGFQGSFIVAYKSGKRLTLEEAGNKTNPVEKVAENLVDVSKIRFKVQVGAFEKNIPAELMDTFLRVGNVTTVRQSGITRYISGNFETVDEARQHLKVLKDAGLSDAFVVGSFNTKIISIEEAEKLQGK